jgi:hypothetical protein
MKSVVSAAMNSLRHFKLPLKAGQPPASLRYRAKTVAGRSHDHALMGVYSIPRPAQSLLTSLEEVARIEPNPLLYMLNMLHV